MQELQSAAPVLFGKKLWSSRAMFHCVRYLAVKGQQQIETFLRVLQLQMEQVPNPFQTVEQSISMNM